MKKNLMLLRWFLKFALFKVRDEYNSHDYIRDAFCPEYMSAEDFDEKEQILRDTPGPAGIKYAYYVGKSINGISGAIFAIAAFLIPVVLLAVLVSFVYDILSDVQVSVWSPRYIFNGMCATALGLVGAHIYKMIYFNKTSGKSITLVFASALVFFLLPMLLTNNELEINVYTYDLTPYYLIAIVVGGIALSFFHTASEKRRIKRENDPNRVVDPYSKKAIKERDRKLREEEYAMQKDRNMLAELKKELNEKKKRK